MKQDFRPLKPLLHKLDGVLFDFDGTLVHNEGTALDKIRQEYERALKPFGVAAIECCRHYAGMPLPQIRQSLSHRYGHEIPASADDAIMQRRKNSPEPGEVVNRIEATTQFVRFLVDNKVPVGIVTSAERDRTLRYFDAARLNEVFGTTEPLLVSGHTDFTPPRQKPHPDAYNRAIDTMLAHPSRVITFEDTAHGVAAGAAARIVTLGHLLPDHIPNNKAKREDIADAMRASGAADIVYEPREFVPALQKTLMAMPDRAQTPTATRQRAIRFHLLPGGKTG